MVNNTVVSGSLYSCQIGHHNLPQNDIADLRQHSGVSALLLRNLI